MIEDLAEVVMIPPITFLRYLSKKKQQAVVTHNLANPTLAVLLGEYGEDRCYVSPANVRPLCRLRRGSGSPPEAAPQWAKRREPAPTTAE